MAEDATAIDMVMDAEVAGCGGSNPPMAEDAQDMKDAEMAGCGGGNLPMAQDAQGNDTVMTMDLVGCSGHPKMIENPEQTVPCEGARARKPRKRQQWQCV